MLKKVNLNIITERFPVGDVLLDPLPEGTLSEEQYAKLLQRSKQAEQNRRDAIRSEMTTPARMRLTEDWFSLSYTESADSDMAGSETQISFHRASPGTVTLLRSGDVRTALVFEQGVRHRCAYTTPFMPFEVGVHCLTVKNMLAEGGSLILDYIIEIRGGEAERCKMEFSVNPTKA
jgi:uncharacterized beta-barrel protein YwiB (DUF1934 family)